MEQTPNQKGQMQWRRNTAGNCELWVSPPGSTQFVAYMVSPIRTPDPASLSKGYATFCAGIKAGYEVLLVT
jgi:hypothetical protein